MARNGVTFWGMVGAAMVALKLKERYDEYNAVPGEEEELGHGPVALMSPNTDEDAADGAALLDTQLPTTRPKRQRKKADCCLCCGMRCGLFWKAFGIVCLLFVGWQAIQLVIWLVKPKPTGLEGMPEFSKSLGCMGKDASYIYKDGKQDISVPVGNNQNKGDHSVDFRGGAIGTVIIAQGENDLQNVKYEVTIRTDAPQLLSNIVIDYPTQEDIDKGTKSSRLVLSTPNFAPQTSKTCMRFDVTMYLPQTVKTMHIQAHASTQIKFDSDSSFSFDSLYVTMYNRDQKNLLLPSEGVYAKHMKLQTGGGYVVGDITVADDASVDTQSGAAITDLRVHPSPSSEEPPAPVKFHTSTGQGRTNVFFVNHAGLPHRPIEASHYSALNGELYLTYKDAAFNGTVDLEAKSFSATGLENAFKHDGGLPYHGSKDGGDKMTVRTRGWAGLYF